MIKYILLIVSFAFATPAFATQPPYKFWTGTNHACGVDDTGFHCWGTNNARQADQMRVKNLKEVAIGDSHTCILDDEGVLCFGDNDVGQLDVPPLKNPQKIIARRDTTCVIDNEDIKCWGANTKTDRADLTPEELAKFENPRAIDITFRGHCVVEDRGMVCWDDQTGTKIYDVPGFKKLVSGSGSAYQLCALLENGIACSSGLQKTLKKSTEVVVMDKFVCVLDAVGVECFHSDKWSQESGQKLSTPALVNPRQISSDNRQICALDDHGVKCWLYDEMNSKNEFEMVKVPDLKAPQTLMNGYFGVCAVDLTGVICWPYRDDIFHDNTNKKLSFVWYKVESFLHDLISNNPPNRGKYFSEMYAFYQTILKHDYFVEFQSLFAAMIAPAVESVDSEYFKTTVIPEFSKMTEAMKSDMSRRQIVIPDSELNRQLALKNLLATLNVASEFLAPEDRQNLLPVIRSLGLATNDPDNKSITQALTKLDSAQATLDILKNSKKTEFIQPTLAVAINWLREHVDGSTKKRGAK